MGAGGCVVEFWSMLRKANLIMWTFVQYPKKEPANCTTGHTRTPHCHKPQLLLLPDALAVKALRIGGGNLDLGQKSGFAWSSSFRMRLPLCFLDDQKRQIHSGNPKSFGLHEP